MHHVVYVVGLGWSCVRFPGITWEGRRGSSRWRTRIKGIMGGWQVNLGYRPSCDWVGRMVGGSWLW